MYWYVYAPESFQRFAVKSPCISTRGPLYLRDETVNYVTRYETNTQEYQDGYHEESDCHQEQSSDQVLTHIKPRQ